MNFEYSSNILLDLDWILRFRVLYDFFKTSDFKLLKIFIEWICCTQIIIWVGLTLPQLAQIDLSCVDVPFNTKQTKIINKWTFFALHRDSNNIRFSKDAQSWSLCDSFHQTAKSWSFFLLLPLLYKFVNPSWHEGRKCQPYFFSI